jgi:hypothetical protein
MLRVVKEFYKNPDEMRKMAINAKYELINWGNYIGRDTVNHMIMTPELESSLIDHIKSSTDNILPACTNINNIKFEQFK